MKKYRLCILGALAVAATPLFAQANPQYSDGQSKIEANQAKKGPSLEEIAREAALDNQDHHYYNKPGATISDYNNDWKICKMIADGAINPSDYSNSSAYSYSGIVGGIMGGFVTSLGHQKQRRDNRRVCLLTKGWRLVKAPDSEVKRIAAMTPDAQQAYRASRLGAMQVTGSIEERASALQPTDPAMHLDAPLTDPAILVFDQGIDPKSPFQLKEGEGGIVLAFRRTDKANLGLFGGVLFSRYDLDRRELSQRINSNKNSSNIVYERVIAGLNFNSQYEIKIAKMEAGDYIIRSLGPRRAFDSGHSAGSDDLCLGTVVLNVPAGKFVYIGDFTPYIRLQLNSGPYYDWLLKWTQHIDDVRKALGDTNAEIASTMQLADIKNGATYKCVAESIDILELPGFPSLARPLPSQQ